MNSTLTYTPEEVATVAGVTRRTVYAWITSGRLPAHKVGPKLWTVHQKVLTSFMQGEQPDMLHAIADALNHRVTVMPLRGPAARAQAMQATAQQQQRQAEMQAASPTASPINSKPHPQEQPKQEQPKQEQPKQEQPVPVQAQQPPKRSIWEPGISYADVARNKPASQNQPNKNKKGRR